VPLQLIVGPAGSGKLELLHDAYVEALRAGADATLVVPTRSAIRATRRTLLARGGGALLGGEVTTFDGVFRAVADRAFPDSPRTLTRDRRLFALRRLVEEARSAGELGELAAASSSPAFAAWLDQAFGRLGSALIAPADLRGAATAEDRGLAAIYGRWWDRQDALGVWDQGRLRIGAVSELDPRRASSGEALLAAWGPRRPLFVHGFDELTRAQVRLVALVSARVPVLLTLPFVDGREALEAHSRTFAELYAAADPELVVLERRADLDRPAAFDRLEAALFARDAGRGDGAAAVPAAPADARAVAFVDCGSRAAERRAVVAVVVSSLREGVPAERIAVLVPRSLDRAALTSELVAAGVPLGAEQPPALRRSSFGHALRSLLRAAWSPDAEASRSDLFTYLRCPGSGFDRSWVEGRERYLRAQGIHGVAASLASMSGRDDRQFDRLAAVVAAVRARPELPAVFALVRSMARAWSSVDPGSPELRQVALALSVLEELGQLGPDERPPGRREIVTALDSAQAEEDPAAEGVAVLELADARLPDVDVLVACGLELGGLDDVSSPEVGISAETRTRLDGALEPPDPALTSRLRLYAALTAPRRRLVLVRREADEQGLSLAPSALYEHLRLILGDADVLPPERFGRAPSRALEQAATEHEQLLALAALARSDRPRAARAASLVGLRRELDGARRRARPRPPGLRQPGALADLGRRTSFNVTGLELFLECSSRWFADRELGLRTLDRGWDRMAIGTAAHLVLERFFRSVPVWFPADERITVENLPLARERLGETVARVFAEQRSLPGDTPEAAAARREVERGTASILLQEARSRNVLTRRELEVGFGGRSARRGHPVAGGAEIAGKIDRVDLELAFSTGAVLHDYKLTLGYSASEIAAQRRLQPMVYAAVIERDENVRALAFVYRALRPGSASRGIGRGEAAAPYLPIKTDRVSDERWHELAIEADAAAAEAVARIRAGDVRRDPSAALRPGFCRDVCSSRSVCRIGHAREPER
jgi:PD-(D/E)XK nuclease superfamily